MTGGAVSGLKGIGLGDVAPAVTPVAPGVPSDAVTDPSMLPGVSPDKFGVADLLTLPDTTRSPGAVLAVGGSALLGALVGGVSDDDWKGAFIGAGATAALVSSYALARAWPATTPNARLVLGIGAGLSAAIAAGVYLRRRKTRRAR